MPVKDRFGMALSTESTAAAAEWQQGVDKLLSQNHGPELQFIRAIELDEGFAMAHCCLAFWYQQKARPEDAKRASKRALALAPGVSRRERQQIEAVDNGSPAILTDFRLPSLDGGEIGPADFAGDVLLVDFWATWCSPCKVQKRIIEGLRDEYEPMGVHFLAISLGEEEETVRTYVEKNPFPYPVLYDKLDTIATGAEIYALPTVMIVDRQGSVSYLEAGLSDGPKLRQALDSAAL